MISTSFLVFAEQLLFGVILIDLEREYLYLSAMFGEPTDPDDDPDGGLRAYAA